MPKTPESSREKLKEILAQGICRHSFENSMPGIKDMILPIADAILGAVKPCMNLKHFGPGGIYKPAYNIKSMDCPSCGGTGIKVEG